MSDVDEKQEEDIEAQVDASPPQALPSSATSNSSSFSDRIARRLNMSRSTAGFSKAPVTKALTLISATSSFILFMSSGRKRPNPFVSLDWLGLSRGEVWRLLSSQLVFGGPSQWLFGLVLLYIFRQFERQFGSRKFASAAVFFVVTCLIFEVCFIALPSIQKMWILFELPSGPYSIIFGFLVYFWADIPVTKRFSFLGIPFTDKVLVYIIAGMLVSRDQFGASFRALFGLLAGMIHYSESLPFRRFRIPAVVCAFFERYCVPILGTNTDNTSGVSSNMARRSRRQRQMNGAHSAQEVEQLIPQMGGGGAMGLNAPEPDAEKVQQLVQMGYTEAQARRALITTHNDINRAATILVEGHAPSGF